MGSLAEMTPRLMMTVNPADDKPVPVTNHAAPIHRTFWWTLGGVATIFLTITFIGSVLMIGSQLRAIHPWAEWTFYAGLGLVCAWTIVVPLVGVLTAPVVGLDHAALDGARVDPKTLIRIARRLVRSRTLPEPLHRKLAETLELGGAVQDLVRESLQHQREAATVLIREHAVLVFVTTAVSQNGRLDGFAVLATNLRLVRSLVAHYGYRPTLPQLVRTYSQIAVAAVLSDQIDDLDLEGLLGQLGLRTLSVIPGTTLIINSTIDGMVNALLTLRVGFVAERCLLTAGRDFDRHEVRRAANRDARKQLRRVVMQAIPLVPSGIAQMAKRLFA